MPAVDQNTEPAVDVGAFVQAMPTVPQTVPSNDTAIRFTIASMDDLERFIRMIRS